MASPGDSTGLGPASSEEEHSCPDCFESFLTIPPFAPGETLTLCASGVGPPDPKSEVFAAADKDGGLYVVVSGTNEVVVGPYFTNYALWRKLCDRDVVFESCGYSGKEDIDRQVLALPPDTP